MKKTLLLTLFFFGLGQIVFAQKEETLAGSAHIKGGFGGPYFIFSQADGANGYGAGGGGGFIINDFFFGGFGEGQSFGRRRYNNRDYDLNLGYGGIWLGYTYRGYKVIHLYSSAKIGWGSASLQRNDGDPFNGNDINDSVFAIAPEVGAEANLLHWFRLGATVGYRFVNGLNTLPGFSSGDFNSPTFALTLRFGAFGY